MLVKDLFDIQIGNNLDLCDLQPGDINFVSRTSKNNGVSAFVSVSGDANLFPAGSLTVVLVGSILETFVQVKSFVTSQNIAVLTPKKPMTLKEKLWYCCCIKANAFRYNYGRNAHSTLKILDLPDMPDWAKEVEIFTYIKLPVDINGNPDWQWMEDYIKRLPYSSSVY